jgi:dTDP-4-dehydrorhamnose 3,5-epimerase
MIVHPTPLAGAFVVDVERHSDERGFFARCFCREELQSHGIAMEVVQCNVSFNRQRGTLRGMHFQAAPRAEKKLVRCTRGAIYDVIVDLRPSSATYRGWFGVDLTAHNHRTLYVPEGFAHGFLTLEDDTEVYYQMSEFFAPQFAGGVCWNEPALAIDWPLAPTVISQKDQAYASLEG